MRIRREHILIAFLVFGFVLSFPGNISASTLPGTGDSLSIDVDYANYLDLDNDGTDDDILTIFTVWIPDSSGCDVSRLEVECSLELPSGDSFELTMKIKTDVSVRITIGWYNSVLESGWYCLHISADADGADPPGSATIDHLFDPPNDGNPGSPVIDVMAIEPIE